MNQDIPNKPKPKRTPKKLADAIALPHLAQKSNWFEINGMPHPYILIFAFCFHLVVLYFFTLIEPIIIKNERAISVEIIKLEEEKPKPIEKKEIIKPIPKPNILEKILKPVQPDLIKPIPPEPVFEPKPAPKIEPKIEETPPKEIKNLLIEAKKIESIKAPNLSKLEKIENKIEIPEQIEDFKIEEKAPKEFKIIKDNTKIINNNKVESQKIDNKIVVPEQIEDFKLDDKPINDIKIENKNKIINAQNPSKILPKIENKINVSIDVPPIDNIVKNENKIDEKIKELEKQKQALEKINNNAPIAKNGELPKPTGITSLGGGGGAPIINGGGVKTGGENVGILPKKPPSFGAKGRNVFEDEGENGTLLGRVGKSLDCAKLGQKDRSEKCPNWQPLEGNIGLKLPPKAPIGIKPPSGIKEPLPPCPPNSPHSNLGVKCIGAPLKKNQ